MIPPSDPPASPAASQAVEVAQAVEGLAGLVEWGKKGPPTDPIPASGWKKFIRNLETVLSAFASAERASRDSQRELAETTAALQQHSDALKGWKVEYDKLEAQLDTLRALDTVIAASLASMQAAVTQSARAVRSAEKKANESEAALAAALKEREWQPIETAPKDGTGVLLWNGYRRCYGWFSSYADGSSGWHLRPIFVNEPFEPAAFIPDTHWQPLPAPPRQP